MTSEDVKLCKHCTYYHQGVVSYDPLIPCWRDTCLRNATPLIDAIHGYKTFSGEILDCNNERGLHKTLLEHIFGEKSDKCGPEGRYYSEKIPIDITKNSRK